jgi:hypothetical protein
MIIKKIFDKIFDEEVHANFLKFGRGEYKDKYLIECKKQAKNWSLKTGPEFVNYLVKKSLENLNEATEIKGIIVSTMDLSGEVGFEIVKKGNFQGIRKLTINTTIEPSKILELMEKYPKVFFALSFKGEDFVLKVKSKAPKSGKPGKESEDGPKVDFCSLKTNNENLIKEIFFGVGDFKEAKISHKINIEEIIYPENMDNLKPAEIRAQSKKKGKLIRRVVADGKETITEAEFTA